MTVSQAVWKGIAAAAFVVCVWLVAGRVQAQTPAPSLPTTRVDPASVAHEVFQDSAFWWKRVEPARPMWVSLSWLQSLLETLWEAVADTLQKIAKAIARFLARLFGAFGGTASDLTNAVLLVVAGLLAWIGWKLYPVIARWLTVGRPGRATHDSSNCQPLAEPADLFEQAGQAFGDGRHAESIRLALLALIARLEKLGLLRYDTTRTNREYQRELRHRAELSASFGQLARIYDRVWYGRIPAERGDAAEAITLCGSLINREDLAPE